MEPNLKRYKTHHHHHHHQSTTRIHDLPREILCEILSRLPTESLISNKVVSKFWYNCISDNKFVDVHLTRSRHQWEYQQTLVFKRSNELLGKGEYELINFTQPKCQVSKLEFEIHLLFQSSCNGLLLFQRFYDPKQVYVFNPVTRKNKALPILEIDEDVYIEHCVLIFDASVQKYKVICFSALMDRCYLYCLDAYHSSNKRKAEQITSTSVAHWRELVMPYEDSGILSPPIMVNNKLHWLACINNYKELVMHTMDVSKEEFNETKIPFATPPSNWGENTIIELMGLVCVTDYLKNLKRLDIWSLQDEEEGHWTKISIPYEFELSVGGCHVCTSVCQTRILVTHKNQIFVYDLKNKDWKTIDLPAQDMSAYFVHTNSLVKWG